MGYLNVDDVSSVAYWYREDREMSKILSIAAEEGRKMAEVE